MAWNNEAESWPTNDKLVTRTLLEVEGVISINFDTVVVMQIAQGDLYLLYNL